MPQLLQCSVSAQPAELFGPDAGRHQAVYEQERQSFLTVAIRQDAFVPSFQAAKSGNRRKNENRPWLETKRRFELPQPSALKPLSKALTLTRLPSFCRWLKTGWTWLRNANSNLSAPPISISRSTNELPARRATSPPEMHW